MPHRAHCPSKLKRLSRPGITRESKRREAAILIPMITLMVRQSRFGQYATRRRETRNTPPRELVPAEIECGKLRKKLQLAVRQVVVNPPRHGLPGHAVVQSIDQPRHDDARQGSHAAVFAAPVPDMSRSIAF